MADQLIKLALNPNSRNTMDILGCQAGHNWQWMQFQRGFQEVAWAAGGGHIIWPMVRAAAFWGTAREQAAKSWLRDFPGGPVLILNEPNDAAQDGFANDPERAARVAGDYVRWALALDPAARFVVGNILDMPTPDPGRVENWARAFLGALKAEEFPHDQVLGIGYHLYRQELPATREGVANALEWFGNRLQLALDLAAQTPWLNLYITEWGVLRTGYSQRSGDIAALTDYMDGCWDEMLDEQRVRAAGWYLAEGNQYTGRPDYVLVDGTALRELGKVYALLPTARGESEPPVPPPEEPSEPEQPIAWRTRWVSGDGQVRVQERGTA